MPAEGRENPLLKKGNSDAFFREKYLTKNNEAIRFTEQSFDPVPSSSTEKKESTGRRIHLELVFDNSAESVNGFPHISVAADNVDLLKSGDIP